MTEKILRAILWIIGLPVSVIFMGVFMWVSFLIDFIKEIAIEISDILNKDDKN